MKTFAIPEAALTQHMAILGKTGSGKTSTEKLVVEHVVAQDFRVCVLDTTKSDWWGITSSARGAAVQDPGRSPRACPAAFLRR
jgi:DNA helicase HerA-like ATPase